LVNNRCNRDVSAVTLKAWCRIDEGDIVDGSGVDVEERSAAERVAAVLREDITSGELRPGARLKDVELAARFDVSRNTLRVAVQHLVRDGLVELRRNAGGSVRVLSAADVRDIFVARRTLELAGVHASARASDDQLAAVVVAARRGAAAVHAGRAGESRTAGIGFHRAVVALNGSPRLDEFFATVLAQLRLAFAAMPEESVFQQGWARRDVEIAELLAGGRREAAAATLRQYLDESEEQVVDALRAGRSAV
jgi:DNA-binding GntR family transcriptional regulator